MMIGTYHLLDGPIDERCHIQCLVVIGIPCAIIIVIIGVDDVVLTLDGLLVKNVDGGRVPESFHDDCFSLEVVGTVSKGFANIS